MRNRRKKAAAFFLAAIMVLTAVNLSLCTAFATEDTESVIYISKSDGNKELSGAFLELSAYDLDEKNIELVKENVSYSGTFSIKNGVISWESSSSKMELKDLYDGIYTLREQTPPDNYKKADNIIFQVEDGKIVSVNDNAPKSQDTIVMIDEQDTVSTSETTTETTTETTSETTTETTTETTSEATIEITTESTTDEARESSKKEIIPNFRYRRIWRDETLYAAFVYFYNERAKV